MAAKKRSVLDPRVDPQIAKRTVSAPQSIPARILFVGRLVERKGVDDLLRGFREVCQELPEVVVEVVGDGPERRRLFALAHELGIGERVIFRGELRGTALYEAYAKATIVVGPSRSSKVDAEGFGTVFIEAGVFGKACLGTKSGGIPDAILDCKTGILVPESDPRALGLGIMSLLTNGELRVRLGEAGRSRALKEFTWRDSTKRLVRLFTPQAPRSTSDVRESR